MENTGQIKRSISDLGIFGGTPLFAEFLHVGRPNIGNRKRLLDRINKLLDEKWLTNNGPLVREFESRVSEMLGAKHCIAICNGTVALEIAIRALGMSGDVIVPAFTFIATAHALQWQEINPVFCDIDPQTHNISPDHLRLLITPRTTGIVGVHVWGRPCDIDQIEDIARTNNLKVIFDASHAFGSSYKGRMIGNFGDAEIFSFHATKFLNTFEGGAIVTNNDELASILRLMKNFGFSGYDNVIYVGTNGKMTEISAAMGLTGLESISEFIDKNYRNFHLYQKYINNIRGIELINYDETEKNNFQYIIISVDENEFGVDRDFLVRILHGENVLARRYFYPGCHRMEPYRSKFPNVYLNLTETEKLTHRVLSLPTGIAVEESQIERICNLLEFVNKNCHNIQNANPSKPGISYVRDI